jgi:sulfopyruvate decarboxylase subunit beta
MKYVESLKIFADRRTNEIVITSAGNSSKSWWNVTHDIDGTFYLDASMSLCSMFTSGLALAMPDRPFWTFMGDGAFCMNPGMLMVERQMNLPNMFHMLLSNRSYGATSNRPLPNQKDNDYEAIARGMGLTRVFTFGDAGDLAARFDEVFSGNVQEHTFVVLEVEPLTLAEQKAMSSPPFDGPELKYRFGRHVERVSGRKVFDYQLEGAR